MVELTGPLEQSESIIQPLQTHLEVESTEEEGDIDDAYVIQNSGRKWDGLSSHVLTLLSATTSTVDVFEVPPEKIND